MQSEALEGTTPASTRPHRASKRRQRIANLEAARQRRVWRTRIIFEGTVIAFALYAFSVIERMVW